MKEINDMYDYILCDTPPNLGLMQGNVLSYVKNVVILFQPENYSMSSLVKILKAIGEFKEQHNPGLNVLGVVLHLLIKEQPYIVEYSRSAVDFARNKAFICLV